MCALGRNVECIDDIFCVKDTKTIYLFRKALYFPCGTILAGTGHFVVNACAEAHKCRVLFSTVPCLVDSMAPS